MTAAPEQLDAVVFDLDGVIRHWNDHDLDSVEEAHGLPPRTILDVAFSRELGPAAITGELTYRQWMDSIRETVIERHGASVAPALDTWESNVGVVDPEMVRLLRRLRNGLLVALLSNGTTRLRRDLHVLDLLDEFDVVFNTAEIGIAKPDPQVFRIVCDELGVDPARAAFIDDLAENVAGAASIGMHAHQHRDRMATEAFLGELTPHV
ncbi:MAG: HAD-IA family hydrolase [Actinomycetia bacterium]|nr:HAD-IA family hydrolase [Actinomycetes bacterium]